MELQNSAAKGKYICGIINNHISTLTIIFNASDKDLLFFSAVKSQYKWTVNSLTLFHDTDGMSISRYCRSRWHHYTIRPLSTSNATDVYSPVYAANYSLALSVSDLLATLRRRRAWSLPLRDHVHCSLVVSYAQCASWRGWALGVEPSVLQLVTLLM